MLGRRLVTHAALPNNGGQEDNGQCPGAQATVNGIAGQQRLKPFNKA